MSKNKDVAGHIEWGRMLKKLNPYTIKKGLRYFKHYGPKEFWIRLHERFEPEEVPYGPWYEAYIPDEAELEKQRHHRFSSAPLISVAVPAYRTPETFLRQMIDSLLAQTYGNWELCIANGSPDDEQMKQVLAEYTQRDSRIRVQELKENLGIAGNTNAALAMTEGEFAGILDHDDLLAPNALYEIALALEKDPELDAVYTDEDKVTTDLSEHFQPHLKPDFNLDLLRSNNYICHFLVMDAELMKRLQFRPECDGAQDYDLVLRAVAEVLAADGQAGEKSILHIPKVLYHWRCHAQSTSENPESKLYAFENGCKAVKAHYDRIGIPAEVEQGPFYGMYRTHYLWKEQPLVSILIPNKDHVADLKKCMDSIEEKSTYRNFEFIIVENNSTEEETFAYYKEIEKRDNVRVLYYKEEFNYSRINNFGAKEANGEYVLLLNNDTEMIEPDSIKEMLDVCMRPDVGIVGAKLIFEDNTIQHAGVIIGFGGVAGHAFIGQDRDDNGYFSRIISVQDLSAVTAACLMVRRSVFDEVEGLNEEFKVAFNDIDFCLKVRKAGYLVVYNPYAQFYHYESKSRGQEDSADKVARFQQEIGLFGERWGELLENGDPYYNPNLTLDKADFSLKE